MKEFKRIDRFLKPLVIDNPPALNLEDDCALLPYTEGKKLVVTKDAIVENVHFLPNTAPKYLARKLLGVNLSDMAAQGATPLYYFIAASLPKSTTEQWWQNFTDELHLIQQEYAIVLTGGDSVSHDGDMFFSLTMIGEVDADKILYRNTAKIGDNIFVSGTIGDAYLGLQIAKGEIKEDDAFLKERYHVPHPRVSLGIKLGGLIDCATDISDGLLADLGHICDCSKVGAEIELESIPLSPSAKQTIEKYSIDLRELVSGGDDYELLFTVAPENEEKVEKIGKELNLALTKIGCITSSNSLNLRDKNGEGVAIGQKGYEHK